MAGAPLRVFYSYSHADRRMLERLQTHMAMLRREGLITEWSDRAIEAGSQWRDEIERELEAADVILLLVSAPFLDSDFCYEEEMGRAVERARSGDVLLIGILLRPVDGWDKTPFAEFQLVPRGARPISTWSNADEAYRNVVASIRAALEEQLPDATRPDDEILSPGELELLDRIIDPEERELQRLQMIMRKQQLHAQFTTRLMQMRYDMRRAVERNFVRENFESEATDNSRQDDP